MKNFDAKSNRFPSNFVHASFQFYMCNPCHVRNAQKNSDGENKHSASLLYPPFYNLCVNLTLSIPIYNLMFSVLRLKVQWGRVRQDICGCSYLGTQ